MSALSNDTRLLSNDVLAKWLLEDFPFRIQLAQTFPFIPICGDRLRYATTGPLTPGVSIDQDDAIAKDTNRPAHANRSYQFAEIATHFRIPYAAQDIFSSNVNDQTAVQAALAVRELLYKFWTMFESGDRSRNPTEFDGLLRLVDPANVIDLHARGLTLEDLDRAREMVRSNDGRCVHMLTTSVGKRAINSAFWNRGVHPQYDLVDCTGPDGEDREEHVLHFEGAQVFVNDLNQVFGYGDAGPGIPLDPVAALHADGVHPPLATNIWFFVLGEGNLHGIVPKNARDIIVRSTILGDGSSIVYHHTMPASIALGSAGALAVVRNATIPPVLQSLPTESALHVNGESQ